MATKDIRKKELNIKNNIGHLYLIYENQDGDAITVDLVNDKGMILSEIKSKLDFRSNFKNVLTQVYNEIK